METLQNRIRKPLAARAPKSKTQNGRHRPENNTDLQHAELSGQIAAINRAMAVIEFDLEGMILNANDNFLTAMGYSLEEVVGQHHRIFVEPKSAAGREYQQFWDRLNHGEYETGEYKRLAKGGREVWIQASYNPIFDDLGRPVKVVKFASDVTALKLKNANYEGQLQAIGKSQAVIEFALDGTILNANDNFLNALGYRIDEIRGQHHRMFVDSETRSSIEYKQFWSKLGAGEFQSGEYKRFGKGGREIWIQATYNPIFDLNGKPFKVVKYASDVTAAKLKSADSEGQLQAISKAMAVIEFNLDGTIRVANDNFLKTLGYSLPEIQGKHHRMFVDPAEASGRDYKDFWAALNAGKYTSGEYKRIAKGGREVWIQASYNPIFDLNGKPFKVVKYASDVTRQVELRENLERVIEKVAQNSNAMAESASELTTVSSQMNSNAEETTSQANVVSAAAEQVSKNTQTVATAIDEMTASIKEIAKNASDGARIASTAVQVASSTNATISKLGDSSAEIGKVIKVITSIAQQTNLLALNATIEAARAGEAGKGFAVVANEVKELAKETAKATEDISRKIEAIQTDTKGAVGAIQQIAGIINQMNDISNTIAGAVEEQSATTSEMGRNVAEAAKGAGEIAVNIGSVAQAAESTSQGANHTQKAATVLMQLAGELQDVVSEFHS